jgi:hypothetical protein
MLLAQPTLSVVFTVKAITSDFVGFAALLNLAIHH